ncbi:MAG TPA: glycerol kinase GlpK [Sedimentisphaerales bacterium]|jgi:glycerol kinase|nr:glycerol kinase GlpK [Sedimentisphaerales bacterium]HNU28597.1 glycerol kinase GlpK [Sedimentisphaerales bacterium]
MGETKYILALDQGTTSSRAMVIDRDGGIVSVAQKEFQQVFPKSGWVEHDPNEIWSSQASVAAEAMARMNIDGRQIAAIGITNQRETAIVWDRKTGEPVYNAIVWQDRRTAEFCDELKQAGLAEKILTKTGLVLDAYFSATKVRWILDHVPGARQRAQAGELAFGTVDSWLVWKLTGGRVHVTDISNASRTLLFNIHEQRWDEELCKLFDVPASMLPEVKSCSEVVGVTGTAFGAAQIPIAGIAGDQQAALFGQMCTEPGMIKNTYGTGCFIMMNTGEKAKHSKNNLLTTIAWKLGGKVTYALEGSIFIAGAVVQWLRDGLGCIQRSEQVEKLANSVADNGGVYVVPAFAGLGAPHWDQYARGAIFGITRGTTDAHIARACLESIAFQTKDVLDAMADDAGIPIRELRVDGGASINNGLMEFQAGLTQVTVVRPQTLETTAMGAAFFAGLAVGYWKDLAEIRKIWKKGAQFESHMAIETRAELLKNWHKAVDRVRDWAR